MSGLDVLEARILQHLTTVEDEDLILRTIKQLGRFLNASDKVEDGTISFELHQEEVKELRAARRAIDNDVRRLVGYVPGQDDRPIEMLGLDTRSHNALRRSGITTIGQARDRVKMEGKKFYVRQFGPHSKAKLIAALGRLGYA